ncbi:MAG: iron ABC transporter permease [Cyclobacteriaceae bacterium]|nr:iron ABC transporter permease [Cyclobacteriaceae bacterium]
MKNRFIIGVLLPIAILVLLILNISIGSVSIPFSSLLESFFTDDIKTSWYTIIWQFRMPKAITAILVGAGLSVCGLQMQTLFRNPLAGPFVLGISSGASLGVALLILSGSIIGGFIYHWIIGSWVVVIASSLGSFSVLMVVMVMSIRVKDSMSLLIIGLMFGSATGALVGVLQYFSSAQEIQLFMIWTFGNLGGLNWGEITIMFFLISLGLGMNFILIKPLNALLLGENYARSMGVNMKINRMLIICSTSLLAGSITAFCGPIAFVGLAVPHVVRGIFQSADHRVLIPASILVGSGIMLFCDTVAQLPGSEYTLPINAITSLLGAPFVIWIILKKRNIAKSF